jgi:hypothetical protein
MQIAGHITSADTRRLRARRALAVLLMGVGLWAAAWGQMMPVKRVRDFRMPEYFEHASAGRSNQLKSLVTGAEAIPIRSNRVEVTQMHVEDYAPDGRTNLVARAPHCVFNPISREISSTGRVEAALGNGRILMEGEGFLVRMTNLHCVISNRVRTVIRREVIQDSAP